MTDTTVSNGVSAMDIALAEAWRPEPDEELRAFVVHREVRTTEYGTYPIVYMQRQNSPDSKLVAVHAFHQTLKDGLVTLAPQRGELVSITYLGKKEGKDNTYHHYVVVNPEEVVSQDALAWDDPAF